MIVMGWSQVISVRTAIKEVRAFIEKSSIPIASGIKLPPPNGKLVVSDVSFEYYDGGKKILDSISFKLEPGNVCAVLGDSGAGKSTLARILVGYETATKGSVRLDGVSVNTWEKELCKYIGYLPQDLQLFGGDVINNITRFKVDDTELEKTCNDFNLTIFFPIKTINLTL